MLAAVHLRIVLVAALLAVAAVAVKPAPPRSADALVVTAAGDMKLGNSEDGRAVLAAGAMKPGDRATGTVTLDNGADLVQQLSLATAGVRDVPGPGGGLLSDRLVVEVERLSQGREVVFSGRLAELGALPLGDLPARAAQVFRVSAELPDGGPAADDPFAGSSVEVDLQWRAVTDADAPGATLAPSDSGERPAGPAPRVPTEPASGGKAAAVEARSVPHDQEGPAPARARPVRLWVGGVKLQRLKRKGRSGGWFTLLVRCRPSCDVEAAGTVRIGRARVALPRRRLGIVGRGEAQLRFQLRPREMRRVRAALAGGRRVRVQIGVRATATGHGPASAPANITLR